MRISVLSLVALFTGPLACDLAFLEAGDALPFFATDATTDRATSEGGPLDRCDAGPVVVEDWSGADRAGWPDGWTLLPSESGFAFQGGEGRVQTETGSGIVRTLTAVLNGKQLQNADIRITMDATRTLGTVVLIATRASSRGDQGLAGGVLLSSAGNSALLGEYGDAGPENVPSVADFKLAGPVRMRLVTRSVPSDSKVQLSMKVWAKNDAEPDVFQYTTTASAPAAAQGIAIVVSGGGAPTTARVDDLSIENLCP